MMDPLEVRNHRTEEKTAEEKTDASTQVANRGQTLHGTRGIALACLLQVHPSDDGLGNRHFITGEPILIGRDPSCRLCLKDGNVSRVHARLAVVGDEYYLADHHSTNGTFVNDEPILVRKLSHGDDIVIGRHLFRFLMGTDLEALYQQEMGRMIATDSLTGVANGRRLMHFVTNEMARGQRYGRPLAMLLLDPDEFKMVNELWGHLAGDYALRELTRRFATVIRSQDMLARVTGEQFAVVMPESPLEDALQTAERLRAITTEKLFKFQGVDFPVRISIGIAIAPPDEETTASQLLIHAEEKLCAAKRAGGNRIIC